MLLQEADGVDGPPFEQNDMTPGGVAQFSLWSKILSSSEVNRLFKGPALGSETGLVLAWGQFVHNSNREVTAWRDYGPNGLHAEVAVWKSSHDGRLSDYSSDPAAVTLRVRSCGYDVSNYVRVWRNERRTGAGGRGFHAYWFDPANLYEPIEVATFDTYGDSGASSRLAAWIDRAPHGAVLAFGVQDEGSRYLYNDVKSRLRAMGATRIDQIGFRESYAFIARKNGNPADAAEARNCRHCSGCADVTWRGSGAHTRLTYGGVEASMDRYGLNVAVLDEASGQPGSRRSFDLALEDTEVGLSGLTDWVDALGDGDLVVGAMHSPLPERGVVPAAARDALEEIGVDAPAFEMGRGASWVFRGRKGGSGSQSWFRSLHHQGVTLADVFQCYSETYTLPENAAVGANVGFPLRRSSSSSNARYSILGSASCGDESPFDINAATGQVVLKGRLDASECAQHRVDISAAASGYDSGWHTVESQQGDCHQCGDRPGSWLQLTHNVDGPPELLEMRVEMRATDGANEGFVFQGMGSAQVADDYGGLYYGGIIYGWSRTTTRVWAPTRWNNQALGRMVFIPDSYGGRYSQMSSTAQVRVKAFVGEAAPTFDSGWFRMESQKGITSYDERPHGLGATPARVKVLIRVWDSGNPGYTFIAGQTAQSGDNGDEYGGIVSKPVPHPLGHTTALRSCTSPRFSASRYTSMTTRS